MAISILERREIAYAEAQSRVEKAMNGDEAAAKAAPAKLAEVEALDAQQADYLKSQELLERLSKGGTDTDEAGHAPVESGSIGERFVKSAGFTEFKKAHPTGVDGGTPISIKAAGIGGLTELGLKADLTTGTGQPTPQRLPGYVDMLLNQKLTILDLISTGSTNSASLEYAQVVGETDNAAIVPEGELKPLSDLTTALQDAKVFTYADGFDATNQFLSDEPALAAFMDSSIKRHIRQKIEDQILNGAGTATAPKGILHTTGVQAQAFDTDIITTIARALEKAEAVDADVQAIVVNPSVAWQLRLLKDLEGRYLSGGPFAEGLVQTLWGVPIVKSKRLTNKQALVGDFRTINPLEREGMSVLMFNQHKDYAQRNKVYVRAEWRGMQPIYVPRDIRSPQSQRPN